ncbi:MAG TPA: KamA family radical SAM protein [Dehalococcoidia bacterium]|nr:KamA family radical SAM protein [Dehalococcoidia bacterium]
MNKSLGTLNKQNQCQVDDDEPPGSATTSNIVVDEEDEPPSCVFGTTIKEAFLSRTHPQDWNDWKWQFQNRVTSVEELAKYIPLSPLLEKRLKLVVTKYSLAITPYYLSLINPHDVNDPIRKQSVPCFEEVAFAGIGFEDPLEEKRESVVPGLVHRYPDRVLMVMTDVCPMLCRHCTRKREWKHGFWVRTDAEIGDMINYIRRNRSVRDVIISGGDPLTLSTRRLEWVIAQLRAIQHVEIIRIGTRFPVVLPQRIDAELCDMLSKYGPIWLNTHFNHPKEITEEAAAAVDRLVRAGVPVNNQSVLLKGVNDTVAIQRKLCQALLKIKVRPYYLYQCDEIQGTEHLRTTVETGLKIMNGMWGHTSGLAVPTYIIDLPQGGGKIPVLPNYMQSRLGEDLIFKNYQSKYYHYRNPRGAAAARKKNNTADTQMSLELPLADFENATSVAAVMGQYENRPVI